MEVPRLADLIKLDDSALITWRRETRAELERHPSPELSMIYDATTQEVVDRAGEKWARPGNQPRPPAPQDPNELNDEQDRW